MSFTKRVEDFICEHCGAAVYGNGYTNHCPKCLWSKHVDNDPGDRAATCGGLMEPIGVEGSTPQYRIVHRCIKCGKTTRVTTSPNDEEKALLALTQKRVP